MNEQGNEVIRVWPDGTWQRGDETPYSHMSDDYVAVYVGDVDDDECEAIAQRTIGW